MPPKVYTKRVVQLSDEQKKVYNELKEQAITNLQGDRMTVNNVLTEIIRLHQITAGFFNGESGQIQKLNNNSIRFHASIAVEGIASQEKDYSGPHLISPKLFANMFDYAVSEFPDIANAFVELQDTE